MTLQENMRERATKLSNMASGYRMAGHHERAEDLLFASSKLTVAALALDIAEAGITEGKEIA